MRRDYESVQDFLEAMRSGRPQTFKEIELSVAKGHLAIMRELDRLILSGDVRTVLVRFNGKRVPFYTVRDDVRGRIL